MKYYFYALLTMATIVELQGDPLRVMTFNYQNSVTYIHEIFGKREEKVARRAIAKEMLREYKPDVLGFQEPHFGDLAFFERELSNYCWIGERVSPFFYQDFFLSGGFSFGDYNAIFYNRDTIDLVDHGQFWLNETMAEHEPSKWAADTRKHNHVRACTWARFRMKKNGKEFLVFNTHLSLDGPVSYQEAQLIANYIEGYRKPNDLVMFIGDFNERPSSHTYHMIENDFGYENAKSIAQRIEQETVGTWGTGRRVTLDYIFLKNYAVDAVSLFKVVNFNRKGVYPSDHSPVMIDYNL